MSGTLLDYCWECGRDDGWHRSSCPLVRARRPRLRLTARGRMLLSVLALVLGVRFMHWWNDWTLAFAQNLAP